ncbi:MAG: alpha/beta fold hydrolase [Anaerolineae bacterium]
MPTIRIDDADLFYALHRGDETNQRQLILIHGAGGSHLHWPAGLRRLPQTNVYALDLPGHGRSGGEGRTTIEAYTDAIMALVEGLSLNRVTVAGHSMGGAITQTLALRRPGWLEGLILVGTGARLRVAPAILDGILADAPTAIDLICSWAYGPNTPPELLEAGRQAMLDLKPEIIHGDYRACDAFDVMQKLDQIRQPTLVIAGSEDKLTPPKYSAFLADKIPGARLVTIEGAGHMMMLEHPQAVARAFAGFFAGEST